MKTSFGKLSTSYLALQPFATLTHDQAGPLPESGPESEIIITGTRASSFDAPTPVTAVSEV